MNLDVGSSVEYKPWPRDPRYLAGSDGVIVGPQGPRRPQLTKRGRLTLCINMNGHNRIIQVHTIVAEAWHGLRPEGKECAHNNGVATDCRPGNLRWASREENQADRVLHDANPLGERHGMAKLTDDDVQDIRSYYSNGTANQYQLADAYEVTQSTINGIVHGHSWKHLETDPTTLPGSARGERHGLTTLTADDVRAIRAEYATGTMSYSQLGEKYGTSSATAGRVVRGETWSHVQ